MKHFLFSERLLMVKEMLLYIFLVKIQERNLLFLQKLILQEISHILFLFHLFRENIILLSQAEIAFPE